MMRQLSLWAFNCSIKNKVFLMFLPMMMATIMMASRSLTENSEIQSLLLLSGIFLILMAILYARSVIQTLQESITLVTQSMYGNQPDRHITSPSEFAVLQEVSSCISKQLMGTEAESSFFHASFEHMATALMLADSDGNIIHINASASKLFKDNQMKLRQLMPHFDGGNMICMKMDDFYHQPIRQQNHLKVKGMACSSNIQVEGLHLVATYTPMFEEEGMFLGTLIEWEDCTVQVRLQEELQPHHLRSLLEDFTDDQSMLSDRSQLQAVAMEKISANIKYLVKSTKKDAESTRHINQLTQQVYGQVLNGSKVVDATEDAVKMIADQYHEMNGMTILLDEIAVDIHRLSDHFSNEISTTGQGERNINLLADSVSSLAHRSAQLGEKMTTLMLAKTPRIEHAKKVANQSVKSMRNIVKASDMMADMMAEIEITSRKHSSAMILINNAMTEVESTAHQHADLMQSSVLESQALHDKFCRMEALVKPLSLNSVEDDNAMLSAKQKTQQVLSDISKKVLL